MKNSYSEISKKQFLQVYNKHLPKKWEKFVFKYFSESTDKEDKWLSNVFFIVAISLFIIALILNIRGASYTMIRIPTYTLVFWLIIFGIIRIPVFFIHKFRLRKIAKELNISISEYDVLASMYL
jgi:fatty acid desaturase